MQLRTWKDVYSSLPIVAILDTPAIPTNDVFSHFLPNGPRLALEIRPRNTMSSLT